MQISHLKKKKRPSLDCLFHLKNQNLWQHRVLISIWKQLIRAEVGSGHFHSPYASPPPTHKCVCMCVRVLFSKTDALSLEGSKMGIGLPPPFHITTLPPPQPSFLTCHSISIKNRKFDLKVNLILIIICHELPV